MPKQQGQLNTILQTAQLSLLEEMAYSTQQELRCFLSVPVMLLQAELDKLPVALRDSVHEHLALVPVEQAFCCPDCQSHVHNAHSQGLPTQI